jgi:hypothetical protein
LHRTLQLGVHRTLQLGCEAQLVERIVQLAGDAAELVEDLAAGIDLGLVHDCLPITGQIS